MKDDCHYPQESIPGLELSDDWLMSFAIRRGRKIVFLFMSSMQKLQSEIPNLPYVFYILRVQKLIEEKRLDVNGDIENWRGCEVHLPQGAVE